MTAMTPDLLKQLCKQNGGYGQPTLNDQLYLQCKGFVKIEHLEPYTQLKVLWLDQNAITDIEGLDTLSKLVSLFLQNNTIRRMTNLSALGNLRIINLSHNYISKIEGLAEGCPLLESLQMSHNFLPNLSACEELWALPELSSVDLSFNKMEREAAADDLCIVNFFKLMPAVTVIYLQGNPLSHGMKLYRKNMVVNLPQLTYLDERPVFPDERRATEAWGRGGDAAESAERSKIRAEKAAEISNCVQTMARAMEMNKEARDRANAAWQARRDEELQELKQRRQEWRRKQQVLEAAEFDARGSCEADEEDDRSTLNESLETLYAEALAVEAANRRRYDAAQEIELVRRTANLELQGQEERITAVLDAQPAQSQALANSMSYWIKQLDQSDEELVAHMEADLENFLAELVPGSMEAASSAIVAAASSSLLHKATAAAKQLSSTQMSIRQSSTPFLPQAQEKNAKKEKVWQQYYQWETAHTSRPRRQVW